MQFFLLTPIILLVYCKSRLGALLLMGVLTIASSVTIAVLTNHNDLPTSPLTPRNGNHYMNQLYIKPWGRILPYLLGIALGISYYEFSTRDKNPEFRGTLSTKIYNLLEVGRVFFSRNFP